MVGTTHPHSARRVILHRDSVRRLRDILRSNIVHGAYPGTKMPAESDLMDRYGAPRAVVREALQLLREEGLVDRLQGYGTYALEAPHIEGLSDTHGIQQERGSGFRSNVTHTTVLSRRVVPTPDAVAALMPTAGPEVYELDYAMHMANEVVGGATNYFRFPEADALGTTPIGTDFYRFLDRCGLQVGASSLVIGTSVVDSGLTASAGVPPRTPLFTMEQTITNGDGDVYDVAFIWVRGDRMMLSSFASYPHDPAPAD